MIKRCGRKFPTKVCLGPIVGCGDTLISLSRFIPAKMFIFSLLRPGPARHLSAEQALAYTWLTMFAALTERDLCGLRENFNLRARRRNVIWAAGAMSHFPKSNGVDNNKKDLLRLCSNDGDDNVSQSVSLSWRTMSEPHPKR
jgi:hypothetical protein